MSIMSGVSKDSYIHRNYVLPGETFERTMKERGPNLDIYLSYADSLSKCGKVREALDVYDHCCRVGDISTDKLKHVTYGLLESVMNAYGSPPVKNYNSVFICVICECVLRQPTTTMCGHTFCKKCLIKDASRTCRKCGQKLNGNSSLETNILVKALVEKFWSGELVAGQLRDEGNELLHRNELDAAVAKFNEALNLVPDDHLTLSSRSHALNRLGKHQAALLDAEHVIKIRPHWGKGHQRRGSALLAMAHCEEALVSFCMFVALEKNPHAVRTDVCKILHTLLSNNLRLRHVSSSSPFATPCQVRFRRRWFQHSSMLNTSDCEDHSSGDEDFLDHSTPPTRSNFYAIIDRIFGELEKLKRIDWKPLDLTIEPSLIDKSDFDCVLCCRTLWKPVTTPCGHTYCLSCLDRSLDYSSACPLCMKSLADYLAVTPKNITEFLHKALKTFLPGEYLTRQMTHQAEVSELIVSCYEKEPRIPVFVCTTAYPTIHCPLFIYEPRYRLMIRRCVEAGTRQFGIAACFTSEAGVRRYADFGTILEIKDWVLMSDGCSILSTVGVRRFRTLSRSERDGYDTAKVELLADEPIPDSSLRGLRELHEKVRIKAVSWVKTFTQDFQEQVVSSFGTIPDVEGDWTSLPDGPSWTWWLLAILPLGPQLQVSILGTTSLEKRLRAIDKTLNHIQDRLQPRIRSHHDGASHPSNSSQMFEFSTNQS